MPRILVLFLLLPVTVHAQIKPVNTNIVPQPTTILQPVPGAYNNVSLNYVKTWTPLIPFTDASDASMNAKTNQQVRQETSFFDRMGREIQLVKRGGTPAEKDLIYVKKIESDGKEHYMYLPYPSSQYSGSFRNTPFTEQYDFYSTPALNENRFDGEEVYYAENVFEQSPLSRVIKEMPIGNSWAGSNRGTLTSYTLNVAEEEVLKWGTLSGLPHALGYYPSGALTKTSTTDAHGKQSVVYKDIEGKIILQKEEITAGGIDHAGWLCTYFVYDDFGLLRFVFPPKIIRELLLYPNPSSWRLIFQSGTLYNLYFIFEYDQLGRKIFEKVPGKEAVEFVYDNRDRVVFTRDGRDKAASRWKLNNYDQLNRIVMEGLCNSSKSRSQLQSEMDLLPAAGQIVINYGTPPPVDLVISSRNTSETLYKATGSIVFEDGFTSIDGDEFEAVVDPEAAGTVQNSIFNPLPILPSADVVPLKYYYYDNYSWAGNKPFLAGDAQKPQQGDNIQKDDIVKTNAVSGYLTGTGVRVLGTNQWLYTTKFYDEKGRVIQTISDNAAGGIETVTNLYDFNNRLISSYLRHTKPGNTSTPETRILNIDNYDHVGRLKSSVVKLNDDNSLERVIASNTYYETGELKVKTLGGIKNINYDYSIGGHLKSINKDYVNGTATGSFGEELFYDYGYTENQFTGEIAGIIWRGDGPARSYGYEYDPTGRLTKADFTQKDVSGNWGQSAMDYSVSGPASNNGRIRYDANGNLLNIARKGMKGGASVDIDVLSYEYYDKSDHLKNVTDANNDPSSTLGDFKEVTTGQAIDYIYDQNGNLTKDENKGISDITYNELDLPASINITGKGTIYYKYDANGTKLEKRIIDNTGTTPVEKKIEFIHGLVYEDNVLKYVLHDEGRIRVIQKPSLPIAYYYDYFIKDHLDNVRIVCSEQTDLSTYYASMESASSAQENLLFNNIDRSRADRPSGYPADSSNKYVAKLNAKYPDKRVGPSLVLKVMAGDTIWAKVNAFYKSQEPVQKSASDQAIDMLAPMLQAFEGKIPNSGKTVNIGNSISLNENFTSGVYQRLKEKQPDDKSQGRPRAYLNYILFDEQLNMVDENSGVKQVQSSPDAIQQLVKDGMEVSRNGYLYVYTSNESQQDVYFDDLIVVMSTGRLIEETHYYPFGLTMKEISTKAIASPTYPENDVRYNSKELQTGEFADGSGLEWYDYGARMYDPQIGRWHAVDNASKDFYNLTPFGYCGNNPIANIDVDGNSHLPINVMELVMRNWYQRAKFQEWQLTTVEGMAYSMGRQRAYEMHKSFRKANQSKISDRSSKSELDASPGMRLFRGMSELLIGMTPVLGSGVRALKALKGGNTGGAVLNTIFAFTEGVAIVGGLRTTSKMGGGTAAAALGARGYNGVREASSFLREAGVPRPYRKQILQSFEVETISLMSADNATFGMRFYGGDAAERGRYLFPAFTNYSNRIGLALPGSWNNTMEKIAQFQIAPGSSYIFGRAGSQGGIYIGGSYQMYINNLNNLIK